MDLVYAGNMVINSTKIADDVSKEHEELQSYIDDYTFWDQLVTNLARRDAYNEIGVRATNPSAEDLWRRALEIEERYAKEFEENGLENIKVIFRGEK